MTETTTVFEQAQAAADAAHSVDLLAALVRSRPQADETTMTIEYALAEPVVLKPFRGSDPLHVTRVRVSVTTFHRSGEQDYLNVEAFGTEATKSGKPSARASRYWRALPDEAAEHLATAVNIAKTETQEV